MTCFLDFAFVDFFTTGRLMRDASADVLIPEREIAVQAVWWRTGPVQDHFFGLCADNRIINIGDDLTPGFRLRVMGIDIGDEYVVEITFVCLLARLCENIPRVRIGRDLLYRILFDLFYSGIHHVTPDYEKN